MGEKQLISGRAIPAPYVRLNDKAKLLKRPMILLLPEEGSSRTFSGGGWGDHPIGDLPAGGDASHVTVDFG
jgi:hypothetical protein